MPPDTHTQNRYAVCIGINDYAPASALSSLHCAENDARAMDEILGKLGFEQENRILLLGKAATLDAVNEALGTVIFNQSKEHDLVVVYFAGHSTPVTVEDRPEARRSEVFLATSDFNRQQIKDDLFFCTQRALGMERLRSVFFEGPGSRKRLFIFDSCHSGDFYGPGYRDGTEQVPGYIQEKMNSSTDGRLFIASCLPYQKALENITDGHGQFTYYLLKAFRGEASDAVRKDGTLTVSSLFDYLDGQLKDQKPVRGGVEFGSFILTKHPHLAVTGASYPLDENGAGKEARLREKWIDQDDFVRNLLERFVGRQTELDQLQECIDGQMESGGYVIITGVAGQGKSSIIAKKIAKQGIDDTAYHFVQFNSGREHQFSLLRSLMARLILKYNLPERYVAGESYPILRDYFLKILKEISDKHTREVIYIDGLDQLEADKSTERDLSFLPTQLPAGIVIVVGTRPNDTLRQLKRLSKVEDPYTLPGLSRGDFTLLLQHHEVALSSALGDLLSEKLEQNPLYLGLVVQELVAQPGLQTEALIARIENNPDDIFGITFSRLQQLSDWSEVVRPMLGTLLVAQEPLSGLQIAHILGKEDVHIRRGITLLGGLLAHSGQQRYTLFHVKLYDYLKSDLPVPNNDIQFSMEEVEKLHGNVARWCAQKPLEELWVALPSPSSTDDYQEYARRHYITHLYNAGTYECLFEVLNLGDYEREKLRFDPSTRSSAIDLMLGCLAAARLANTLADGKKLLVYLWRYTLLRTSLTSRADAYPIEAFPALLALGKEQEVGGLIELVTQPEQKLAALLVLARYLLAQPERANEGRQLYSRIYEIATTRPQSQAKTKVLSQLTAVLIQTGYMAEAEEVARDLQASSRAAEALAEVSEAYGQQQNWQQAEAVARAIEVDEVQMIRALSTLASQHQSAARADEAERLWQEANAKISTLTAAESRDQARAYLATSYLQVQEWMKADETADALTSSPGKMEILSQLALAFTSKGLREQAETVREKMREIKGGNQREHDLVLQIKAMALVEAGNISKARAIAENDIYQPSHKLAVFGHIASYFIINGMFEQILNTINPILRQYQYSDVVVSDLDTLLIDLICQIAQTQQWEIAKEVIRALPRTETKYKAMIGLVIEMAKAGLSTQAEEAWVEAKTMFLARTSQVKASAAGVLVAVQAQAGHMEEARENIATLPDNQAKEYVWEKLALALADMNMVAEAGEIGKNITTQAKRNILRSISIAQMEAGSTDQALETARSMGDNEQQSNVLRDLVTVCCQKHQWELAQKIVSQIPSDPIQGEAMNRLLVGLVKNGKLPVAQNLAKAIDNVYRKENAWYLIITSFARISGSKGALDKLAKNIKKNERIKQKADCAIYIALKQPELAASVARNIPDSDEKSEALYNVTAAYARDRSWKQAEEIAGEIGDEKIHEKACADIALGYANAGQWERALSLFERIKKGDQREVVLQTWGTLLAQSANDILSKEIVNHLGQSEEKATLLVSMANTLAQTVPDLNLLRFIQRSWLQANTKDDCQYFFEIVRELLLRNPEMCADFDGSFRWVDEFLNE